MMAINSPPLCRSGRIFTDFAMCNRFSKNLQLGEAAKRDVGTGENQIPDMSSFGSGSGWSQLPNGKLLQWGTYTGSATSGTINFPVPFPSSVGRVIMSLSGTSADAGSIAYVVQDDNSLSKTSFFFRRAGAQVRFNWFCIGE
ncbi:phage tail protein [Citrobacter amalonaticus]|uniref:gp53-like domain-containing protein n=1 Tax=Citrobacter amalonaticus TaxID=35703 RepID=UPI00188B4F02|nr:phage tail protein [Citrobacter amalonaticus]